MPTFTGSSAVPEVKPGACGWVEFGLRASDMLVMYVGQVMSWRASGSIRSSFREGPS